MLETAGILILIAALLLVCEVFIPSGGLLGLSSFLCVIAGIVFLFIHDWRYGMAGVLVLVVILPIGAGLLVKMLPHLPMARLLTLRHRQQAGVTNYDPALEDAESRLVGAEGRAMTDLRPVGTCVINGDRIECLAETGVIESGQRVTVVSVSGIEVKVRAVRA